MSNKRNKGRLSGPWIAMDRHQYKSAAFAQLSAVAQALLVHLTSHYHTKLMNSVHISTRVGAKKLNVSRGSVANAMHELEHYGFIVKVRGAYLGVEGVGKSAHYRLTAQRYGNVGATRDYEKWDGEMFTTTKRVKQNPVHQEGHTVHQAGHKDGAATPQKMEQVSTRRAIRTAPECPPGGPYLVQPDGERSGGAEVGDGEHPPEPAVMGGLTEWYTPELRALYCNTADPQDLEHVCGLWRISSYVN
jgi:DNA-binding transcriptional regulator YhcF (GntR family)